MQVLWLTNNFLLQFDTNILEATVFGVPDPSYQEIVAAAVVLMDDCKFFDEENLIETVNSMLDNHEQLRNGVMVLKKLPRNSVGKIVKNELGKSKTQ